jgi:serine/threonine-protein kinase
VEDPTVGVKSRADTRGEIGRGASIGRYLLLDQLGIGGMGVVYKAYDPELDRQIALKLLRFGEREESAHRDRLLREAQALARLQHPNVIAVHDVGTFRGDVFIAMELVEGQTLRRWLDEGPHSPREILEVFLAAADGLQAAHHAGLIHRDFKPDNVMVGNDGRVRVLDFGVARMQADASPADASAKDRTAPPRSGDSDAPQAETAEPRPTDGSVSATDSTGKPRQKLLDTPLTHAGTIVGTPRFMPPEQHLGKEIDASADQFSFGVSLYWALYKQFPFDSTESVFEGRVSEPNPGRVPRWLHPVLVRSLAAKPAERFPSMAALSSALRADPGEARRRWLRAALLIIATMVAAVAVIMGGLALKSRRAVAEQARLAQQFGQEVERIGAISRYSASLPLHDTQQEMVVIRERMERLKERMRMLGALAEGPGHEALGRGYLALERYGEALSELDAAYRTGYRSPELAYALGMVHGKLYERALDELKKTHDEKMNVARRDQIARAHRDPALKYLKEAEVHEGQLLVGIDAPEYVEGLIALYERRFEDALVLAKKAGKRVLWLYEARTLEGDIHFAAGKELFLKGDVDGALAERERAGAAYRAAVDAARSGATAYLGDCRRLVDEVRWENALDRSPEATLKRAVSACTDAATARPDDPTPFAAQATAWLALGHYQELHSVNPTAAQEEAIRLGERALSLDPRHYRSVWVIGDAYFGLGSHLQDRGGDPRVFYGKAIEEAQKAIQINQADSDGYSLASESYAGNGNYEGTHGIDPRPSYGSSIEYAKKAIALSPDDASILNSLVVPEIGLGEWEMTHGHDPSQTFNLTLEALRRVLQVNSALDYSFVNQCAVYADWGDFEAKLGKDPRPRLEQALAACEQALKLDHNYYGTYTNLASVYIRMASWQLAQAIDPAATLDRAHAAIQHALDINHDDFETLDSLCEARIVEGRWAATRGRDPTPNFAAAEAAGRRALAISDGRSPEALRLTSEVYRRRAEWREQHRMSADRDVREGLALATRALEQNPSVAKAAESAGALHLVAARAAAEPGDQVKNAVQARQAFESALGIDANLEREIRPLHAEAIRLAQRPDR